MASKTKIKESDVKKQIKDYLTLTGWCHYPNMAGIGSEPGLSDRTALKNGITLWIEAKSPTGKQSDDQIKFEKNIKENKGHYVLARSVEDLDNYIRKNLWKTGVEF